jgi:hypothetical protein
LFEECDEVSEVGNADGGCESDGHDGGGGGAEFGDVGAGDEFLSGGLIDDTDGAGISGADETGEDATGAEDDGVRAVDERDFRAWVCDLAVDPGGVAVSDEGEVGSDFGTLVSEAVTGEAIGGAACEDFPTFGRVAAGEVGDGLIIVRGRGERVRHPGEHEAVWSGGEGWSVFLVRSDFERERQGVVVAAEGGGEEVPGGNAEFEIDQAGIALIEPGDGLAGRRREFGGFTGAEGIREGERRFESDAGRRLIDFQSCEDVERTWFCEESLKGFSVLEALHGIHRGLGLERGPPSVPDGCGVYAIGIGTGIPGEGDTVEVVGEVEIEAGDAQGVGAEDGVGVGDEFQAAAVIASSCGDDVEAGVMFGPGRAPVAWERDAGADEGVGLRGSKRLFEADFELEWAEGVDIAGFGEAVSGRGMRSDEEWGDDGEKELGRAIHEIEEPEEGGGLWEVMRGGEWKRRRYISTRRRPRCE